MLSETATDHAEFLDEGVSAHPSTTWKMENPKQPDPARDNGAPKGAQSARAWKLERVAEVHSGSDSVVRVVSIKTIGGVTKRRITELCVLPFEGNT